MVADSQSPHVPGSPPRKRRPWQYGLSTLLLVVTAAAIFSWWYAQESREEFQQRFTDRVEKLGGELEWGSDGAPARLSFRYWGFANTKPLTDEDLRRLRRDLARLGPFTLNLSGHEKARGAITDDGLAHLIGLKHLECLALRYTDVTDDGLQHLARFEGLQFVDLRDTHVSEKITLLTRPNLVVYTRGWQAGSPSQSSADWKAPELRYYSEESVGGRPVGSTAIQVESQRASAKPEFVLSDRHLLAYDAELRSHFIAASDVLLSLHGPISDSGVQLARIDLRRSPPAVVWEVFASPLGVDHSKYRHSAHAFHHADRCVLVSDGAATFVEIRDLATGGLRKRWVY